MKLSFEKIEDDRIWDEYVKQLPEYSFLNSSARYKYNIDVGIKAFRYVIKKDEKLVGIITGNIGDSKLFGKFLDCKHSPMLIDDGEEEIWSEVTEFCKDLSKENDCFMFRFSPLYIDNDVLISFYKKNGFIQAPIHNVDSLISQHMDLTKDMESLKSDLSSSRRNMLNKLSKMPEVEVKIFNDDSQFDVFEKLHEQTVKVKGYTDKSTKLLLAELKKQVEYGMCYLVIGYYDGKPISVWQNSVYGKNMHLYQACSSTEFRQKNMIITPILYWKSLELGKELGCTTYDLFGGVTPKGWEEKKHPWSGVGEFKRSLGGEKITYLHSRDYPVNKIKYWVYYIYSALRTRLKGYTIKW